MSAILSAPRAGKACTAHKCRARFEPRHHTRTYAVRAAQDHPLRVDAPIEGTTAALEVLPRRSLLAGLAAVALSPTLLAECVQAEEDSSTPYLYQDGPDQFSIDIPGGWAAAEGQLSAAKAFSGASGARRALAWFVPGEERQTNVTVVITNIGADFTSLGSFGTVYTFGTNLVNSMDQSYLLRAPQWAQPKDKNIQVARLVDAREENSSYNVEYTVANSSEGHKHLVSRVLLGYNGTYNRLYTITAQCQQEDWEKYESVLKKVVSSFKPPKLTVYK